MWPRDANSPRPEPRHWSGFAKRMPFPLLRLGFPCPRPKDGRGDEDGGGNFHGQQRKNDTHASTSDPDSRLYRKAAGREAKLCYMGHATMENRHGLAVAGMVTCANGAAVPELRELLNDNDPSARAEALVALGNLAGKGAPPAELKSLSAHG